MEELAENLSPDAEIIALQKIIGERIDYALRKAKPKKITQVDIGKILGIGQSAVSKWVKGENCPSAVQLYIIAVKTGRQVEWFYKPIEL